MAKKQEQIRIFFIQRKWWTAAACLCLAAMMFYVVNYPAAVGASAATRQLPIYCVQRDQKLVAISFDAAWGDAILRQAYTGRVLSNIITRQTIFQVSFPGGSFGFDIRYYPIADIRNFQRQLHLPKDHGLLGALRRSLTPRPDTLTAFGRANSFSLKYTALVETLERTASLQTCFNTSIPPAQAL